MKIDATYLEKVGKKIALTTADALDKNQITIEDYEEFSYDMQTRFPQIIEHTDLLIFLQQLSDQWPVFKHIYEDEQQVQRYEHEGEKAKQAEELLKNQQIDKAVEVLNQATPDQHNGGQ